MAGEGRASLISLALQPPFKKRSAAAGSESWPEAPKSAKTGVEGVRWETPELPVLLEKPVPIRTRDKVRQQFVATRFHSKCVGLKLPPSQSQNKIMGLVVPPAHGAAHLAKEGEGKRAGHLEKGRTSE